MVNETEDVIPGTVNPDQPTDNGESKPCLPCLLPSIMGAWNSTRAACEFLSNDDAKEKCRVSMAEMAKSIKDISSAEEVIYRAINSAESPIDFIDAEIQFAKTHNAANSAAILRWADEQEAAGVPIPEKILKVVKILRLERGSVL